MTVDDNKGSRSLLSQLHKIKAAEIDVFNKRYQELRIKNAETSKELREYDKSRRSYLRDFRKAVLKDFTENREYDRCVKKWLVAMTLVFLGLMFLGVIFVIVASILNIGEVSNLSPVFKGSVLGIVISGCVSLSVIIFKYIFNRTDDVFYRYSVDLYKHITDETSGKRDKDK